jgi:hypothetical protein
MPYAAASPSLEQNGLLIEVDGISIRAENQFDRWAQNGAIAEKTAAEYFA